MNYATTKNDVQAMFGDIAPRYDAANMALSMGVDRLWRGRLIRGIAPGRIQGVDLCTGTGDLLPILARRGKSAIGADFCAPMLKVAANKLQRKFPLVQSDALNLPFADQSLDYVTVAFGVRNFESVERGLKEIARVLNDGGEAHILEFGQPRGLFGALFRFYSKFIMPRIGQLITGNLDAYTYLPRTSAKFPCGVEFEKILKSAGFGEIRMEQLTGGIAWIYRARK